MTLLTQMQETIHIGEWERRKVLGGVFILKLHRFISFLSVQLVKLLILHEFDHGSLDLLQVLQARLVASTFLLNFFNHCCKISGSESRFLLLQE